MTGQKLPVFQRCTYGGGLSQAGFFQLLKSKSQTADDSLQVFSLNCDTPSRLEFIVRTTLKVLSNVVPGLAFPRHANNAKLSLFAQIETCVDAFLLG
jgi:hypothetical protein